MPPVIERTVGIAYRVTRAADVKLMELRQGLGNPLHLAFMVDLASRVANDLGGIPLGTDHQDGRARADVLEELAGDRDEIALRVQVFDDQEQGRGGPQVA